MDFVRRGGSRGRGLICVNGCIGREYGTREGGKWVGFRPVDRLEEAFLGGSYVTVFQTMREVAHAQKYIPSGVSIARNIAGTIESFDPFRYNHY